LNRINVGIIGVSGYTGLELVKMLVSHPIFNLSYCANTEGATTVAELHPSLVGVCDLNVDKVDLDHAGSIVRVDFFWHFRIKLLCRRQKGCWNEESSSRSICRLSPIG